MDSDRPSDRFAATDPRPRRNGWPDRETPAVEMGDLASAADSRPSTCATDRGHKATADCVVAQQVRSACLSTGRPARRSAVYFDSANLRIKDVRPRPQNS